MSIGFRAQQCIISCCAPNAMIPKQSLGLVMTLALANDRSVSSNCLLSLRPGSRSCGPPSFRAVGHPEEMAQLCLLGKMRTSRSFAKLKIYKRCQQQSHVALHPISVPTQVDILNEWKVCKEWLKMPFIQ